MKRNYFRRFLGIYRAILFVLFAQLFTLTTTAEEVTVDGIKYDVVKKAKQATVIASYSYSGALVVNSYSGDVVIPLSFMYDDVEYSVTSIGDYAFEDCTSLTSVTIPNSVTSIGKDAFRKCTKLVSVTIPNSVTNINNGVFYGCSSLTSVTIPNSVISIGASAFRDCSRLTSVTISNSVTSIESSVFQGCSGLTSVTIPNSVTSIGNLAFRDCSGLTSIKVTDGNPKYDSRDNCNAIIETSTNTLILGCQNTVIPNNVTSIGNEAFYNCKSLTSVTIPNSVTRIGASAFKECKGLTSVIISDSVTSISSYTFQNCTGLTSITIPNSVTSIGDYAFNECTGLTSVTIGNSVKSLGEQAFSYCPNIEDIIVEPGNKVYDSRNSCKAIIETAKNALVLGCKYSSISNDVTEIFSRAFCGVGSYINITIPVSVSNIRKNAFCDYDRLNVSFLGATPPEIENNAFSDPGTVYATVPRGSSIAYSSFGFAEVNESKDDFPLITINLTEAGMLQDKLLDLDDTDIRRLKISGFITGSDISYLRSSSRLSNLRYLDISEITLVPSNEPYAEFGIDVKYGNGGTTGGSYARFYISEEEKIELVYSNPNGLGGSNQVYAYYSRTLAGAFEGMNLEHVILPPSFDRVGAFCFKGNGNLKEVSLPNNSEFKYIDEFAFTNCESLEELLLPSSVIFIGPGAFYGCKMLNNIGRLDNVKCLGKASFGKCVSLRNVGSLASVEILDYGSSNLYASCFTGCSSLVGDIETGILDLSSCNNIPGQTNKYYGIFSDCSCIQNVKFSKNLKSIGSYAFSGCTNISSITFPEGLEKIESAAFSSCSSLTTVNCPNSLLHVGYDSFKNTPFEQNLELDNGVRYMKDIAMSASSISSISFREGTRSIADEFYKTIDVVGGNYIYSQPENCKFVTLPSTLQCIGEESFCGVGITSLSLPESLKYIGSKAFYNCTSLSGTLTIPENVSFIGGSAFSDCSGVAVVNYNANTREGAGTYVFGYCTGVDKVTIGPKVEVIPKDAFIRSNMYKLVFAERTDATPLKIGNAAFFENKNIKEIILPNGTDSIGQQAFDCCFGLTSVTIPNSVTCIGNSAFYGCSLTSVICQARNVPATGKSCFTSVPQSSATLYVPASSIDAYKSASQWKDFGTILPIDGDETSYNITATANPANGGSITGAGSYQDGATVTLTATPAEGYEFANWTENGTTVSTQATYTFTVSQDRTLVANFQKVDEGNNEIYYSFNTSNNTATVISGENKYTGNVVIPETVTYQGTTYTVTSIDNSAFAECAGLTSVTIGNNVRSIGYAAFDGCRNLKSVTFGSNMTIIGSWAFYRCSGLTSVTIPNSVTSVGEGAFSYCSGMTSATIGNNVTSIGNSAFSYCSDLTSVTIGNSVRSIGNSAFVGCSSLTSVNIPNSVTSIASGIFWGCTSLKSITIPNSVESIGSDAFTGCESLASVTLNANNIVSRTYTASSNLKSVFGNQVTEYILGDDVTSIGDYAFHGCSDLTSVSIPNSVTSIGESAFGECTGLVSVTLNSNAIASKTYTSGSNLKTIFGSQVKEYIFGDDVTGIGNYATYGCSGLTSVTIGSGVTSIGTSSFYGCSGLKYVVCKAQNVPSTGSNCFGGITLSSATLYVPAASVNKYKSTSPWSGFGTVTSIPDNFNIWEIKLNRTEILLYEQGDTYRLTASVVPGYAANKTLRWTSSNTSVATVDANGLVTPVSQGTAVITATTLDGSNLSATCVVTVDADNVISDLSQLSNDKCYYFYTKDKLRGGLGVNKNYGSIASTFSVTNAKYKADSVSPFVVFNYNDNFYLYSVEANAFVTYNGGLTRTNITGSNAVDIIQNENGYFMISFAATGRVLNINTNPGLAINYWGTSDSEHDEGNQFTIEVAGDCDEYAIADLINESNTYSDEDIAHYSQTPVQSLSELSNAQVYTAVTYRAAWYVPASGTRLESTRMPIADKYSCSNTGQQFAFIQHNGQYYIYSVGEKKILNGRTDNNPNHGVLVTENCQPVSISETGDTQYPLFFNYGAAFNVNIDGSGNVAIDSWSTLDAGNMVVLRPVQGVTLSDSEINRIIRYIDGSIPGDVNGDGEVNGADIVAVINYVLNDSKTDGDVNEDGEVNGADIVAVINYVLSYTGDDARQQTYYAHRAPERPVDTCNRLYANTVTDGITVGLTNETDFTAFQFILQLPEDCTLENVIADGLRLDNHVLQFRRMADGRYFVLGYNLDNENIAGHDGALLRLQLAGNICEGASVTDVMFFTPEAETRHLAGIQIDLVTGLTSLENATEDVTGNIYDMQGRVVMTSGQYAKQKNFLPTGIYIRNGRKFVVK